MLGVLRFPDAEDEMTPKPLQRSRQHPYPPEIRAAKILDATRGCGKLHGNPYTIFKDHFSGFIIMLEDKPVYFCGKADRRQATKKAVELFRTHLLKIFENQPDLFAALIAPIKAADYVACWCPLPEDGKPDDHCHRSAWIEACGWV